MAKSVVGVLVTEIVAVATFPSLVAEMVATPGAMAATVAFDGLLATVTVATDVIDDCHWTARPSSTLPCWSRTVTYRGCCAATSSVALDGTMTIDPTDVRLRGDVLPSRHALAVASAHGTT
jgi:NAD/NADP transhydrogenase beta subunit